MNSRSVELIGCGALAEQVYAPVFAYLESIGRMRVTALVDPVAERRAQLAKTFPEAKTVGRVEDLPAAPEALAVIASPPGAHASQTCTLLAAGRHVLCEKPLATSVSEAEKMITVAQNAQRLLVAGMMRRFYPSVLALRKQLAEGKLAQPVSIDVVEGGRFGWNAASPKFFEPTNGGVLYDLGSHVLDLLCHLFGEPAQTTAQLDALGGTNTNALIQLDWKNTLTARIRLSWDTPLPTGWRIRTLHGECRWDGSHAGEVNFKGNAPNQSEGNWRINVNTPAKPSEPPILHGWSGVFVRQLENVLEAIEGKTPLLAPAADVLPSLRCLEQALHNAELMPQPWLAPVEQAAAVKLAAI